MSRSGSSQRRRPAAGRVPLNRALSKLGLLSRAQATDAILAGRVRVDGQLATMPSMLIVPERARIDIDGRPQPRPPRRTLILHKPRGVVTTRSDPESRPTVHDIAGATAEGLAPVGRLDYATSGLLLMTNDTPLANWITDPSSGVLRAYIVTVRGRVTDTMLAGLPGARILKASNRESHLAVELREGRNRQVRRMFASVGREVTRLKRVRLGGLELGRLEPGEWRLVSAGELRAAFPGAPVSRAAS